MQDSKLLRLITFALMSLILTSGALVVAAGVPQPAQPVKSGQVDPTTTRIGRSTISTLKVNEAEILAKGDGVEISKPTELELKPMTLEINGILDTAHGSVADLQAQFEKATDSGDALDLVRRIETLKINAELDILRVQLKYADQAGNDELVRRLESDLLQMTTPRPRKQPIDRPASSAGNR